MEGLRSNRASCASESPSCRRLKLSIKEDHAGSEKSARKFFSTWRNACDKTKGRTKELLKRTLSWKGRGNSSDITDALDVLTLKTELYGWSVHEWTTWVKRMSASEETLFEEGEMTLAPVQTEKFIFFYEMILKADKDQFLTNGDFDALLQKLRHFADWSKSSVEYCTLKEFMHEFQSAFCNPLGDKIRYADKEIWIKMWSRLLKKAHVIKDVPFWLQQMPRVFFRVINKKANGVISKGELGNFYASIISPDFMSNEDLSKNYDRMTASGDFRLTYDVYEMCFANWLFGKNPEGSGQWLFGKCGFAYETFPIDYSALNAGPEDRETYSPHKKSDRRSVMV